MVKFYFYYLVMNVGKIIILLQLVYNYCECGMCVVILILCLDDCVGYGVVVLWIGLKVDGVVFDCDIDLQCLIVVDIVVGGLLGCVLVDEVQFFICSQVWQLSEVVDELCILVLCYGLCIDFCGELFEGSQYLLVWVDEMQEIKIICYSGKKVMMIVCVDEYGYVVQDGLQVEIGGNECYVLVSCVEFKKIICGEGCIDLMQVLFLL